MTQTTKQQILNANLALHKKEATLYDNIHPELTNREESNRLNKLITSTEPHQTNAEALDVGAGTGFVTQKLLQNNYKVTAIDLSKEMLNVLKQKLGADCRLFTQITDVDSFLGNNTQKYHFIAGSSVLHHLPDYKLTIQSLIKHLEPNGYLLFFHEPTSHTPKLFERFLRKIDYKLYRTILLFKGILPKLKVAQLDYTIADYHITHGFDENKILEVLKQEKMTIIKIERYVTAQTWIMRLIFKLFFPASTWSLLVRKLS